jgi:tetratricopeptide (TPR) repeat protein
MSVEDLIRKFGHPGDPDYHNNLGMLNLSKGHVDDAIREYNEAIRLRPNDALFHCNLASALAKQGDHENAFSEYELAIRLDDKDALTHYNLGNLYSKVNQPEHAIQEFLKAIQLEPDRAGPYYNLAGCYWDLNNQRDAAIYYEKALDLDSNTPVALLAEIRVGTFYLYERIWQKAEIFLLNAFRRKEDDFLANYFLTIVYLNISDDKLPPWLFPAKAILHIKKALDARPDDTDALQLAIEASKAFDSAKPPDKRT